MALFIQDKDIRLRNKVIITEVLQNDQRISTWIYQHLDQTALNLLAGRPS